MIVVTGSNGYLGQHLMTHLHTLGHDPYGVPSRAYDLRRPAHIDALFKHVGTPDIIFHLAANVGGIQYNIDNPGAIFYDNVMMTTQLIHKAAIEGVGKFIMVGSACSYPENNPLPITEDRLWAGYPEPTNGAYGVSKLIALTQLQAHGINFAYPILANLYGPGGGFDERKSHVIPALIKRFASNPNVLIVWGDGKPTRDFLYVEDAAKALARFIEVDYSQPVNIASGIEVSIGQVVGIISQLANYKGTIEFDASKPNGQMRRCYDISKAKSVLGWQPSTDIETGLRNTWEWYANNCHNLR